MAQKTLPSSVEDVTAIVKDAAVVTVGLGVIAFQRFQVRRLELDKAIAAQTEHARGAMEVVAALVAERLKLVEERVGAVRDSS